MFSVIFEVHPKQEKFDLYLELAKGLRPILEGIDGFIDNERFESTRRPGWILSHSTWRDEKSVVRWRTVGKHHDIQPKLATQQREHPSALFCSAATIHQHMPGAMRKAVFIRFQLHVADGPIEQCGGALEVVEAFAAGPPRDIAHPHGFLQQPAFVRLKGGRFERPF